MIAAITNVAHMKKVVLLALISVLWLGCQRGVVYSEFQQLPAQGWEADSALQFVPNLTDTLGSYQVQIILRHTDRYAYQNLWLFVDVQKDSILLRRDTIESYLANERGEWYGSGMSKMTLPLLYMENIALPAGEYRITVQQGMREEQLRGITDVGLKVINN